ncbi:MAG: MFS transporter, partial [Sphingomonadaceae bacterium]
AWVAAEHGWRTAFLAVGLPGLAAALVVLLFVREPERGRLDRIKGASDQRLLSSIVRYFRSPLLVLAALGGAFASFVWIAMLSWMPPLLLRTKGMTLGDVAAYYSVVTGVASLSGAVAGGFIADRWGRTNPRSYALVPCITLIVSIPFYLIALWLSDWRLIMVVLVVPFTAYAMFMAPTIALIHNSVEPSRRAMCSAIYLFIINLIGTGGGPLTVGWLSDHFAAEHGLSALPVAMTVVTPVFLLAAATYALAARRIRGPAR